MNTNKKILALFLRYLAIIIFAVSNFYILQKILAPSTIHLSNLIINIFTPTILTENIIQFGSTTIQIAMPCLALSAFYLLLALIFSTADIKPKIRLKSILTATAILFILNVARILLLSTLTTSPNFETIHWFFWHIISTVMVIATYVTITKVYKIKSIPIISDFKYLKSMSKTKL